MAAIITSNFRTVNASHFKEQIEGSSVYVAIGKSDVWSLTTSDTTDTTPFVPGDNLDQLGEARANLIGMKKIVSADIAHVVPRHTWTSGNSYFAWDSDDASIFDKAFYIVVTAEFKVYKCIEGRRRSFKHSADSNINCSNCRIRRIYMEIYVYNISRRRRKILN